MVLVHRGEARNPEVAPTVAARCSWVSGDLFDELGCALPAHRGGLCTEHAHDAERERAMERAADAERDVIRGIVAARATGADVQHLRPCVATFSGAIRRRIATALLDGERLDLDLEHELGRILVALPDAPLDVAAARHASALRALAVGAVVPMAREAA